jgi:hypothetical protein
MHYSPGWYGVRRRLRAVDLYWDTERNRLVMWGGGHDDYAGSGLYAFDVQP